ncbi:MAG: ABC transporter permease [Chloroflexi bacterium]|nr:ABC transporter permease [Chloroflexota bacterium]
MLLARRNLFRDRTRFLLSVLGVAVSIGLILLLAGYRSGIYRQASAYLDHAQGSVVVAERGVRDFLGTSSVLPAGSEGAARQTPGVAQVTPVVSQFVIFEMHGRKDGFFLVGYDPAKGGGPWDLAEGREPAVDDEIVVDRTAARQHGLAIGDQIRLLDRDVTVVGLSGGTTFWAGSMAFARISTLQSLLRAPDLESFLLVSPAGGTSAAAIADRLSIPGTEVLLKGDVIANDRKLMARVYDAPIGLMVAIAFVVGVLVVGLVIYTATIERRREYGALKAIGARNRILYRVVALQALIAAVAGSVLGVGLAYGAATGLMAWRPQFQVEIEPVAIVFVLAASLLMAVLAALIPARAVARLEPAEVFRG